MARTRCLSEDEIDTILEKAEAKRLSPEQVAADLGISARTVSRYMEERGYDVLRTIGRRRESVLAG